VEGVSSRSEKIEGKKIGLGKGRKSSGLMSEWNEGKERD
jgi:hypothetical protein